MAQLFRSNANALSKLTLLGIAGVLIVIGGVAEIMKWSPYATLAHIPRDQPIPFSHKHHVKGAGIDCRYCHVSVETSAFAGLPATETCMTCHSQIWKESPVLKRVRESYATGKPIRWNRVIALPDYVYFNHSVHIHKGVACVTCHGRIDKMPLTRKVRTFYMRECLACHRYPEYFIGPREEVFNMKQKPLPFAAKLKRGESLVKRYGIDPHRLTNCYACHR